MAGNSNNTNLRKGSHSNSQVHYINFKYSKQHFMVFTYVYILIFLTFIYSCSKQDVKFNNTSHIDSTEHFYLTDNQKKVLSGAKKCLEAGFKYDNEMAYHVLKYRNTVYTGSKVYPMGDLDPSLGVCTEVTIRALRWGGVSDLQEEIHIDIKTNWKDYPMSRWNAKKPDPNIDHRRVPNQLVWFKKHWDEVSGGKYQPGDVVVWDMDDDTWADHIGIISDNPAPALPEAEGGNDALEGKGGVLLVIHNFPSPGYAAEEDVLNRWKIVGVFRVRD